MMELRKWKATHRIWTPSKIYPVMLVDGAAYTREEWDTYSNADFEREDENWLFQGAVFEGTVEKL